MVTRLLIARRSQGLQMIADQAKVVCRHGTYHKLLAWAEEAPAGAKHTAELRGIAGPATVKSNVAELLERSKSICLFPRESICLPA
jgi:hypothetical protein